MQMEVIARHFQMNEALRQRTVERLQKLTRFHDRIHEARVVVTFEKNRFSAEAVISANGTRLTSHAEEDTDKVALEQVMDKLEVQMRRFKDRTIRSRRRGGVAVPEGEPAGVSGDDEEESFFDESDGADLVSEDAGDWGVRMSALEAAAQLRVSRREVLAFTNSTTNRPAVIFKRRDGNLGVVDVRLS